jgi:integrase
MEEFELDKALWTIPFKKLKQRKFREGIKELTSKPHFVPLSRQAVALLGDLKKLTGNRRYLFPGSRGGRPLFGVTRSAQITTTLIAQIPLL